MQIYTVHYRTVTETLLCSMHSIERKETRFQQATKGGTVESGLHTQLFSEFQAVWPAVANVYKSTPPNTVMKTIL